MSCSIAWFSCFLLRMSESFEIPAKEHTRRYNLTKVATVDEKDMCSLKVLKTVKTSGRVNI